jgi:MFS family permease
MDTTASGERIAFRDGVRSATFWRLSAAMFLHIFYFSGVTVHFVAFTTDLGFDPATAAVAFGALLGLGIAGRLLFGWAADRLDRRAVMVGGLVVTAVAALGLQRITAPGALPAFVVLHGISVAGVQTLFALLVADCFGTLNVGTFLGATMLFQVPGGVAGAILAAASFDRLGSYAPAYALFALGNVVAALAVAGVRPYARATSWGSRSPPSAPTSGSSSAGCRRTLSGSPRRRSPTSAATPTRRKSGSRCWPRTASYDLP